MISFGVLPDASPYRTSASADANPLVIERTRDAIVVEAHANALAWSACAGAVLAFSECPLVVAAFYGLLGPTP